MSPTRPLAALVIVAMLASSADAQTMSGADRYMGSAQSSLGRTNGMISSIAPNSVTRGAVGGSAMVGATQQSFDRTTAAMRSMLANREATVRGLGEAAVYRTPDNLYGVYWQMHYANQFRMYSNLMQSGAANTAHAGELMTYEMARRRLQQEARGREVRRRFDRSSADLPPNPGIFSQETILNDVPGADLLRRDAERAVRDLPPPFMTPVPAAPRRRTARD